MSYKKDGKVVDRREPVHRREHQSRRSPRRPDTIAFLNGLPVGVFEFKSATDKKATVDGAFNQIQTYKDEIAPLFRYNEVNVISDGTLARVGSLTADRERFMPWRTVDGKDLV